jgi:steroid 5-alpha reductase family enzyme
MSNDMRAIWVAYGAGLAVAVATILAQPSGMPIATALRADVAATLVVFACSLLYRNSSFYDPYWSVAPPLIGLYWWWTAAPGAFSPARAAIAFALVLIWSVRLTWNWARGWQGLHHEDWRYVRIRQQTGAAYWPVSLLGIHGMPTLIVFLGCLPLYPALAAGARPFGGLDGFAFAVTAAAIALEARADQELVRFRRAARDPEDFLATGLWARSRHPNYLGEIGFWWGLFLFGWSADPGAWWTGAGALAITVMFRIVSLPLIEQRMSERRPQWAAWAAATPLVVPRIRARSSR